MGRVYPPRIARMRPHRVGATNELTDLSTLPSSNTQQQPSFTEAANDLRDPSENPLSTLQQRSEAFKRQRVSSNRGDDLPNIPPAPRPVPADLNHKSGVIFVSRVDEQPRSYVKPAEAREQALHMLTETYPDQSPPVRPAPASAAQDSEKRYKLPKHNVLPTTLQPPQSFEAFNRQRVGSNLGGISPVIPAAPRPIPASPNRKPGATFSSKAEELLEARQRAYQKFKEEYSVIPPIVRLTSASPAQDSEKRYTLPKHQTNQPHPYTRAKPPGYGAFPQFSDPVFASELPYSRSPAGASFASNPQHSNGQPTPSHKTAVSHFLQVLPAEIRLLVYKQLLCSSKIVRGGDLVEDKRTAIVVSDDRPSATALDIDATILRTCRQIYNEALPILYQDNWFGFSEVRLLRTFRTKNLAKTHATHLNNRVDIQDFSYQHFSPSPMFAFQPETQGRLTLIKSLHLCFTHSSRLADVRGWHSNPRRTSPYSPLIYSEMEIVDPWVQFLNEERYHDQAGYVAFPKLEDLILDFSAWKLKINEGLRVRPFEAKFRGPHGLKSLTTVGLLHKPTVEQFMKKLLNKSGRMKVLGTNALGKGL